MTYIVSGGALNSNLNYHYCVLKISWITVTPPSDFRVLNNFCTKTHSWKIARRTGCKHLSGFHYQTKAAFEFTRIEPSGLLRLGKCLRSPSQVPSKSADITELEEMVQMTV